MLVGRHRFRTIAPMMLAVVIVFAPGAPAQSAAAPGTMAFAVASVRPNNSAGTQFRLAFTDDGVRISNASLLMIIRASQGMFNSLDDKFIGIPGWASTAKFDIEAKVDSSDAAAFKKMPFGQRQRMVQEMLADRFQLKTHHEMREQPIYALVVAKGGAKLRVATPAEGADPGGTIARKRGEIVAQNIVLSQLISQLTQTLGRTVQDRTTGLTGKYDMTLDWAPDDETSETGPSIFTAIQEQLGLRLESTKGPVEVLVVDHVERPSEN